MFFALIIQLAKLTLFLRFRKFNLVTKRLRLKIVIVLATKTCFSRFWIFKKSSTFASGKCGEICLLATTLKNAKKFHIVFLVYLHVFRIRWSFSIMPSPERGRQREFKHNAL